MQIFSPFALEAKSAMRIYPHPAWEGLRVLLSFFAKEGVCNSSVKKFKPLST